MATTEASKLEVINIIIYICAKFFGVQHMQFLTSLGRSDTLEHCLICVSFIFYMIPDLKFVCTCSIATLCAFGIHIFFTVLTIGEAMLAPQSNLVSLKLGH